MLATKGVSATVVLLLADRGLLNLVMKLALGLDSDTIWRAEWHTTVAWNRLAGLARYHMDRP
ncbi:hypothetical protein [Streptomyces phaeochromogenes]